MSDIRSLLRNLDGSAPAIQSAAGAMMKHYGKSSSVAVTEWRNALHQSRPDQHLPLLYVANEVLQNSKRNRGNKFLEAFSPILGQALIYVCQNNGTMVEKVRRTVKIWGDRRVFSIRYVNELLQGMEPYRNGGGSGSSAPAASPSSAPAETDVGRFSPPTKSGSNSSSSPDKSSKGLSEPTFDGDADNNSGGNDDDDDDDDDLFGDAGDRMLDIELDLDKAAAVSKGNLNNNNKSKKRGRDGLGGTSPAKLSRRRSVLSTSSLMDLWNKVATLQDTYDHCQGMLSSIDASYLDESSAMEQIDTLVGDELLQQYKQTLAYEKRVTNQRKELHSIARERRALELEAIRYLPWLETALKQDQDDMAFCLKLEKQVAAVQNIHGLAKAARNVQLETETKRRKAQEELERKKAEEEERKKFMQAATAKVTEAEPGMVWNKATGEYQYLHTDESWRD
ncbi:unnamed protein product [Cylindrotheca closterium]|uniref:CID domain-containing protein n=1 Tax=Cylindrotheca closterium TaxID=2856 RepID=A0AAD2CJZ6_9STRA|nr:unnamed protein product [Cylindrotheca closterium]